MIRKIHKNNRNKTDTCLEGWGVGDTHFTGSHIEGIHISLGICVRGYTYHGDTHITVTPVVKWSITHTKMLFFFLFWPGHSQKNSFLERANKRVYTTLRFLTVYFYRSHSGDHRKQGEKLQCKG